ncbi:MAG: carboxysome peptide A [Cyanobacteria bacterium K_Offshore_surface_m2_239]|nr:carboxysome peptide A [Cyanobacteria bacterium K_Offshore_surface_m2_239]
MIICKVVKPLVSTNRIPDFEHKYLQVVLDGSTQKVAVDAVGAMPGDWVICVGSSAAREAAGSKSYPSDLTIVGIIDHWDPEEAKVIAKGSSSSASAPPPSSSSPSSSSTSASSSSASASASGGGNGGLAGKGGTG